MCLVLAFSNAKKLNLSKHLNKIGGTLLKEEKDGFGYAIQGKDGVFGEKTISNKFRTRLSATNIVTLPIVRPTYEQFGVKSEITGPALFHGRTSTNQVSLINTHPIQLEGWSLIHNGVVDDNGPEFTLKTTNDSEFVLRRLIDGQNTPDNPMAPIEAHLEGYYAFAAIDPAGRLHICRDTIARLYIAYSAKYETYIIGTTDTLILTVAKMLDANIGPIDEIESEMYFIMQDNDLVHSQYFTSRGYFSKQAKHAVKSLGHELPDNVRDVSDTVYTDDNPIYGPSQNDWRFNDGDEESDYYKYRNELDHMDASYTVYDASGKPITLLEFRKMYYIDQELCSIIRGDGTMVEFDADNTPRLYRGGQE